MTVVVRFATSQLDPAGERPNPCNPIAGETLLRWLVIRILEILPAEPAFTDLEVESGP